MRTQHCRSSTNESGEHYLVHQADHQLDIVLLSSYTQLADVGELRLAVHTSVMSGVKTSFLLFVNFIKPSPV